MFVRIPRDVLPRRGIFAGVSEGVAARYGYVTERGQKAVRLSA